MAKPSPPSTNVSLVEFRRAPPQARDQARGLAAWWWRAPAVALAVALGYLAFRFFVTDVMPNPAAWGLVPLAVAAGAATFFSPCSFPLLLGYLAYHYREAARGGERRAARRGWAAAGGVVSFTVLLGLVVGLAGTAVAKSFSVSGGDPSPATLALRIGLGSALVVLGVLAFTRVTFHTDAFPRYARALRLQGDGKRAARNVFLYGFGYNAAGIGCAGPILAGLVVFALAAGGFALALAGFLVYGATMGVLMLLVSSLVPRPESRLLARLRASTPRVKRAAGSVQVAVGLFLIAASLNTPWFVRTFFP